MRRERVGQGVGRVGELADLVLLAELDALPQVAVGHRLRQVADLGDRPGDRPRDDGGDEPAQHDAGDRDTQDPPEPARVRGLAEVAAGRGLLGEQLVEVGDPRRAFVHRDLRLVEGQRGAAIDGV